MSDDRKRADLAEETMRLLEREVWMWRGLTVLFMAAWVSSLFIALR